jgi:hypothetical protein
MGRTVKRWGPSGAPKLRVAKWRGRNEPQPKGVVLYPRITNFSHITSGGLPSLGKKR